MAIVRPAQLHQHVSPFLSLTRLSDMGKGGKFPRPEATTKVSQLEAEVLCSHPEDLLTEAMAHLCWVIYAGIGPHSVSACAQGGTATCLAQLPDTELTTTTASLQANAFPQAPAPPRRGSPCVCVISDQATSCSRGGGLKVTLPTYKSVKWRGL